MMQRQTPISFCRPLAWMVAALCILPGSLARAEDGKLHGSLVLGVGASSMDNPSGRAATATGSANDDQWLISNFLLNYSIRGSYLNLSGRNIAPDNSEFGLGGGSHGRLGLEYLHAQMPYVLDPSARTPFDVQDGNLSLPTGFVKSATSTGMTGLTASLKETELRLDRRSDQFKLFMTPGPRWRVELAAGRQQLTGNRPIAGLVSNYGGGLVPLGIMLPAPIDEETTNLTTALNYQGDISQWALAYRLSDYRNQFDSLRWDSPYAKTPSNVPLNYPVQAQMGVAPSNQQRTLSLSGAMTLPLRTRLNVAAERSWLDQNEALLPYTINPASAVTTPLPRDHAGISAQNTLINLNLSSRPMRDLALNARYRYRDRNNDSPIDLFQRVRNDAGNQSLATESRASYNRPYQTRDHRLALDGDYQWNRDTTLRLGVYQEIRDQDLRAVQQSTETALHGGIGKRIEHRAKFDLGIEKSRRRAESYAQAISYSAFHSPTCNTAVACAPGFDTYPALAQYDIASRDRQKVRLDMSLYPTTDLTLGFHLDHIRDDYAGSALGLSQYASRGYTFDMDYSPEEGVTFYGFVTREDMASQLKGNYTASPAAYPSGNNSNWTVASRDRVVTAGVGGVWPTLADRLLVRVRLTRTLTENAQDYAAGTAIPAVVGVPDNRWTRNRLSLSAEHPFAEGFRVVVGFDVDRFSIDDWDHRGINPGSADMKELIVLSSAERDYTARRLYTTVGYKW